MRAACSLRGGAKRHGLPQSPFSLHRHPGQQHQRPLFGRSKHKHARLKLPASVSAPVFPFCRRRGQQHQRHLCGRHRQRPVPARQNRSGGPAGALLLVATVSFCGCFSWPTARWCAAASFCCSGWVGQQRERCCTCVHKQTLARPSTSITQTLPALPLPMCPLSVSTGRRLFLHRLRRLRQRRALGGGQCGSLCALDSAGRGGEGCCRYTSVVLAAVAYFQPARLWSRAQGWQRLRPKRMPGPPNE